ncbi:MAG: BREX-1 system phosphatase PglZ type A [Cyclobacteriaceae bacterium]
MDLQKEVQQQFERYPDLRVLFFFDGSQSFQLELTTWSDKEIILIKVEGQFFTLKYRLETELRNKKVFLYFPEQEPNEKNLESFALADVLVANKQLHVDPVMAFIEEFSLPVAMRSIIEKYYQTDLRLKNRKDYLSSGLTPNSFSESWLKRGLLCYHLNLKRISDYNIITAQVFILALTPSEFEAALDKLRKLDLIDFLNKILIDVFGDSFKELNLSAIKELANKLKYNLILATIPNVVAEDQYGKLKDDNPIRLSRLTSLINDWNADVNAKPHLIPVLEQLASGIKEEKLINWYGTEKTFGYYTPALKKRVLEECVHEYETQPGKVKQSIKKWFDNPEEQNGFQPLIEYIWHAASMIEILNNYRNFIFDSLSEYIRRYEHELYKVDLHYRKAVFAFGQALKNNIEISLDKSYSALHDCYEKEFISPLNNEWMKCLKSFDFKLNTTTYNKQYNFYKDKIASRQRTAVIISDAFRYEAARELLDTLSKDSKNSVQAGVMLASIPSVTSLGMSNLLPNKGITITDKGFTIDGISTEGTINRTKILQSVNPKSQGIDYNDLVRLDVDKGREYIKQFETIYVYHNKIDARGEKQQTEKYVFDAVKETIDDLMVMIRKLSSWNVYRILITADHGFLLSIRDLPETMKEEIPSVENEFLLSNRSVVAGEIKGGAYQFEIADTSNIKQSFKVALPRSINRYRRPGCGVQYVHGGASLQELLVPVIEYSRMREDTTEKVKIRLIKFDERISSGYLKLTVLQMEPIGKGLKEMEVSMGLYSETEELASNESRLVFNSTSNIASERSTELVLTLSSKGSVLTQCMLKAFDVEDDQRLNPLFSQRIMIQSLIQRDEFK